MIFADLNSLADYAGIAPKAVELMAKRLPELTAAMPNGKEVLIEDKLFILIQRYATHPAEESKVEIHRNFADLQMLVAGNETIGFSPVEELEILTPYDEKGDYALYRADWQKSTSLAMKAGNFAIFLPEEGHIPGCGDGSSVVKAVVKIHKSLLVK